jgi:hypothetical protein
MAATATIRGRFAARTRKSWDSFTDNRTGEIVAAGRALTLHVVTDGDEKLEDVKVPKDLYDAADQATSSLVFGDVLELAVAVDRYGLKFVRCVSAGGKSARPVAAAS